MGLFGRILNALTNENKAQGVNYTQIFQWVEQQGGLHAIIDKFQKSPLADMASSWVGTGENHPITSDHISQIFSSPAITQLGEMLGVNSSTASTLLAQVLPNIINTASPDGEVSPAISLTDIAAKLLSK